MMLLYFLIIASILFLIMVYLIYLKGTNIPKKINYFIATTPTILSIIVLTLGLSFDSSIDFKYIESTAESIKYYPKKTVWKNDSSIIVRRDLYTLTYNNKSLPNNCEFEINKKTFNYFKDLWKTKEIILEDSVIEYLWNKLPEHSLVYTRYESFNNLVLTNTEFIDIDNNKAIKLGIYDKYPLVTSEIDGVIEPRQNLIYSPEKYTPEINRKISNISSIDNNFRPILCIWDSYSKLEKNKYINCQKSLWNGGGSNEVIFCIGKDNDNKIIWSGSFSWCKEKGLENNVLREAFCVGDSLDLDKYCASLINNYKNGSWVPIDYNYSCFDLPYSRLAAIILSIITVIINIGLVFYIRFKK